MPEESRWVRFKATIDPYTKELKFTLSRMKRSPLSIIGIAIIGFFAGIAVLAPVLAPPVGRDPFTIPRDSWLAYPLPPNDKHPFGTTEGQYDLYYGCIWGTITAFRIGLGVEVALLLIGLVVGMLAGYYGGIMDEIMMRFTDIILAFPGLILAMALVVALQPLGWNKLDIVMIALVIVGWPSYARVMRGEAIRIKNEDYIEAAKASGCGDFRVITRHIIPNAIFPAVVMFTLGIGGTVISAAALSFLGLGAPIGYADWGQLVALSRNWIYANPIDPYMYWYVYVTPGLFLFFFVLGWNLLGDAFRDVMDPTIRRK